MQRTEGSRVFWAIVGGALVGAAFVAFSVTMRGGLPLCDCEPCAVEREAEPTATPRTTGERVERKRPRVL